MRFGADVCAAERARSVSRVDLHRVVEGENPRRERVVQLAREHAHLFGTEQVRAADRTDEKRVAGEEPSGIGAAGYEQAHVFRRVTGRVKELEPEIAERNPLTITHFVGGETERGARPSEDAGSDCRELSSA